jgi:hypothetical protein
VRRLHAREIAEGRRWWGANHSRLQAINRTSMTNDFHHAAGPSAWNPGVSSSIPREFQRLETIHWKENVFTGPELVEDFVRITGLPHEELATFRPARLALHEVIVRVTADIAVSEGASEEVFGQNFRLIAGTILADYVAPQMLEIERMYEDLRERIADRVRDVLEAALGQSSDQARPRAFPFNLFKRLRPRRAPAESPGDREYRVVAGFKAEGLSAVDPFERAVFRSLYRVLGAVAATCGRLGSDHAMFAEIVTRHVCNNFGSRMIGRAIAPSIEFAIEKEGYIRVANRAEPVLISLKGASAAGKSSIRPMVKRLLLDSGIEPDGYATISPDVWRRLLLDYDSLGAAYKYAGHLTSREVVVIDAKLDRYIRDKANQARAIPHLLVDRFRFDSFSAQEIGRIRETYAKYVSTIHMYFVVTPPEETVERGWQRALERGRYKAVEDFLGHCVEAYTGMPKVLFRWLGYRHIDYRYYFLDNRVPRGAFPTLIASGDRAHMKVYDPEGLINIERYQKINVEADSRAEVYPAGAEMELGNNSAFLRQCMRRIPVVSFCDGPAGNAYLEVRKGAVQVLDWPTLNRLAGNPPMAAIIREIVPDLVLREPCPFVRAGADCAEPPARA